MRNSIEIYVWMKRNGHSVVKIQRALKFKTHAPVSNTLAGRTHNRRILGWLLEKGCPAKYVDLPKYVRRAA